MAVDDRHNAGEEQYWSARPAADGSGRIVSLPKYQQLADTLREQIEVGALPAGAPVPSDAELVGTYGVSQTTARSAIRKLRDLGLLITYHGRGSFVRRRTGRPSHTHPRAVTVAGGRHQDASPDGEWSLVQEPSRDRIDANADLALALGVAEHAPVFVHDRLLGARDGRRLFHRVYLPVAITAEVPALAVSPYREPADLYDTLATAHGPLHWTESVRARVPTPEDLKTLRLPDATPIVAIRRVTHAADGRALAVEDSQLSAEDTQLTYALPPAAPPPRRGKRGR